MKMVASRWPLVAGATLTIALFVFLGMPVAGQSGKPSSTAKPNRATPAEAPPPDAEQEIEALRRDLLRMHSILDQMRTNLGYVSSTTQPLRHQFELEIDMWQIEMGQTERRLRRLEAQAGR